MKRHQNPELLSMVGLGTDGGQLLADGSRMPAGIHLRWQLGEAIDYPPFGFDLYRRPQLLDKFIKPGHFVMLDNNIVSWSPVDHGVATLLAGAASGPSL